jgi:hydroxymethylpyrimidine pyrophosphatase-like HAD family hydrolase
VDSAIVAALERVRASGRKIVLVTGRRLPHLVRLFPRVDLFDRIVAENGALLYSPLNGSERTLADPPPRAFIAALEGRGVSPLSVGRVIVATSTTHEATVQDLIEGFGVELQIILNKSSIMVLPSGVDKASGLDAALVELGISPLAVVGVGDAENDLAFLVRCGCAVAVANALESVKARADLITAGERGAGVVELIEKLLRSDLFEVKPRDRAVR